MSYVVDAETFKRERDFARFHEHNLSAEVIRDSLTVWQRIVFRFAPVQIGHVDFGDWEADDPRRGTPRQLPLYLFEHGDHVSIDYAHGFSGHNERLTCHCGHNHYFVSSRLRELRAFGAYMLYVIRSRISREAS